MTRNPTKDDEVGVQAEQPRAKRGPGERRPYRAPQLRHIGSVRELTLGPSPTGMKDTGVGRFHNNM